jgi:D-tyrosyl-tRNA(Tyr) deacylase
MTRGALAAGLATPGLLPAIGEYRLLRAVIEAGLEATEIAIPTHSATASAPLQTAHCGGNRSIDSVIGA